jgi:hypothetical protein
MALNVWEVWYATVEPQGMEIRHPKLSVCLLKRK